MRTTRLRLPVVMLALGAAALTVAAGMMLFSAFMFYEDESYVLYSLRAFAEHGHLYSDVYTQYGPFPYVLYYFLHALGLPFTHDAGRVMTLILWAGCATISAATVWRVTRNSACMLATLSSVFIYLWIMTNEPTHPGGLAAFVTAIMGLIGYGWLAAGKWRQWALLVGTGSAILVLTKINVGAFALLSVLGMLLLHSRSERVARVAPWLIGFLFVVLPFALMRPLLGEGWVKVFVELFIFAAIPTVGSLALHTTRQVGGREWCNLVVAGLAVVAVVLGTVVLRGTTPTDLMQGMLLGPLAHPGHFSLPIHWRPGSVQVASASLGLFLLVMAGLRLGWPSRRIIDTLVAVLRLLAAVALAYGLWRFPYESPERVIFGFCLAGLWVFLWPLSGEESGTIVARGWLGLLFLGQWLHAFPVPGSQLAWGSFLAIPLATIGAWQAAVWLSEQQGRVLTYGRAKALDLLATFALVLTAVTLGNRLAQLGYRYVEGRSMDLPGAEAVRMPDKTVSMYRILTLNTEVHADMVFSLPGMFGFNLWTGLPTPTLKNVTHWFSLLDDKEQQAIITVLKQHPRACVIVHQPHLTFLHDHEIYPSGPLYDYIMGEFEMVFSINDVEFRVHRGRHITPLQSAEFFIQKKTAPQTHEAAPDTLIKFSLLLPAGQSIGSFDLLDMELPEMPALHLDASNTRIETAPVALENDTRGPTKAAKLPLALTGRAEEIGVYFDRTNRPLNSLRTLLIVRGVDGSELALVRLRR